MRTQEARRGTCAAVLIAAIGLHGCLFTVRVGADQLQAVSRVDAYASGSDPRGAWYDELLVSASTVVVIGQRLAFYAPILLQPWGQPWSQMMPAWRRGSGQLVPADFERILPATRVYRSGDKFDPGQPLALRTVTHCDLGAAPLRCESTAALGPAGRMFYVSAGSVHVWTQTWHRNGAGGRDDAPLPQAAVFRLPLDGTPPGGLKTSGVPTDQMSFLEDAQGHLNVLLREQGVGEGMWGSRRSAGRTALLRAPLSSFGDGRAAAALEYYRMLPGPEQQGMQNRFVGDWLLWGAGERAWALRYAGAAPAVALAPGHAVERIEALGEHA